MVGRNRRRLCTNLYDDHARGLVFRSRADRDSTVVASIDSRIAVSARTKNQTARVVVIKIGAEPATVAPYHSNHQSGSDALRKSSAPISAPAFSKSTRTIPA